MGTFRVRQQHGPDRRNASPTGHKQQFALRIVSQIEMPRRPFELCLLSCLEMEEKAGARTTRYQIEQKGDDARSAGLRRDGIGSSEEAAGLRIRHLERHKWTRLKVDGFGLDQLQIQATHIVG